MGRSSNSRDQKPQKHNGNGASRSLVAAVEPPANGSYKLAEGQLAQLQRMARELGELKIAHSDSVIASNRLAFAVLQQQERFNQLAAQMAEAQGLDTKAADYDIDLKSGSVTARPRG